MNIEQYSKCADAMLLMWINKVVTDGEYHRIMDKLSKFMKERERAEAGEQE